MIVYDYVSNFSVVIIIVTVIINLHLFDEGEQSTTHITVPCA